MMNAIKNSDYSVETWKNIYSSDNYKKATEQVFGSFFNNASLKEVFDNATKQMQNFFVNQNGLGKEYYEQMKNMSAQFPELFSGNSEQMKELYAKMNNVFAKTLNTTYDNFSKNMTNPFNKDMFKNMFEGKQMYLKVQ